ncbi:hypothetical protein D3C78_1012480 [compost metagenome]
MIENIHDVAAVAETGQLVAQGGFQRPVPLLAKIAQFNAEFGNIGDDAQHPATRQRRLGRQHPAPVIEAGLDGAEGQLAAPRSRGA